MDIIKSLLDALVSIIKPLLNPRETVVVIVLLLIAVGLFLIPHSQISTRQLIWPGFLVLLALGFILISKVGKWWMGAIVMGLFVGWSAWCYFTYTRVPRQIRQIVAAASSIKKDNNYSGSFTKYMEAYNLAKENNLIAEQLACLREMSELEYLMGEYAEARKHLDESRNLAITLDDQEALGYLYFRLGDVERFSGNISLASEHFKDALTIYEQLGNKVGQVQVYRGGLADLELYAKNAYSGSRRPTKPASGLFRHIRGRSRIFLSLIARDYRFIQERVRAAGQSHS